MSNVILAFVLGATNPPQKNDRNSIDEPAALIYGGESMITADGRSAVEVEIEQMQFTGLDTRNPIFGLDDADLPAEHEQTQPLSNPSFFTRWFERLFDIARPAAR
jgi:hypothetical protein